MVISSEKNSCLLKMTFTSLDSLSFSKKKQQPQNKTKQTNKQKQINKKPKFKGRTKWGGHEMGVRFTRNL